MSIHELQERGEPHRRRAGIDGTAGDAQDIPHEPVPAEENTGLCLVCLLSIGARVHSRPRP